MRAVAIGTNWRVQIPGLRSLGMHTVLCFFIICGMAFLAGLVISKGKFAPVLVLYFWMRVCRDIVMTGFTLDPNGTMHGMTKIVLCDIK